MISHDVSEVLFDIVDELLEEVIPVYVHQLEEANLCIPYIWIDNILNKNLMFSMQDRAIWYLSLEELIDIAVDEKIITELDREDFLINYRLGVK